MDYVQFITTIGTAVSTIYIIKSSLDKKFDDIKSQLKSNEDEIKNTRKELGDKISKVEKDLGDKISKVEGEMDTIKSMLHALVGALVGHKTGTDGK